MLVGIGLVGGPAHAAGFYLADVGTRGLGRAGAFVAAPEGPLALHYNPAGLSLSPGLEVELSLTVVQLEATFRRSCPCIDPAYRDPFEPELSTEALDARLAESFAPASTRTPLTAPFVGLSYGFRPWKAAVGLAVYGPPSGRHDYGGLGPATAPSFVERARAKTTRYNALEAPNLEVNYVLGGSIEPLSGLRIGAGLFLHQTGARQTLHLFADTAFADGPEDPGADVPIVLDFLSDPVPNWSIGVSYDVPFVPGLSIGGSYRGERSIDARGTIDVDLPTFLREIGASVEGREVEVRLRTAPIARVGLQYRQPGWFSAETALVWEGWSVNDRIRIQPRDIAFQLGPSEDDRVPLGEIVSERNWRDTWSLRVGGELELLRPELGLQAGYFYEPSAIPARWLDPSRVDLDKHGFALGLSTEWYGVTLAASAMYIVLSGVEVSNSQVRNTAPLGFRPELRTTVGNGRYEGTNVVGAFSLGFSLERFLAATRAGTRPAAVPRQGLGDPAPACPDREPEAVCPTSPGRGQMTGEPALGACAPATST